MQKRKLGNSNLEVSALGLGCIGMSQSYGTPEERDERESIATIHRAIELGCTVNTPEQGHLIDDLNAGDGKGGITWNTRS